MPEGSSMAHAAVSIGATAAIICAGRSQRDSIVIQNVHASQDLYVGMDNTVTTANSVKVPAGGSIEFTDYNGPVWGIGSGAGTTVRYLEVY